MTMAGRLAFFLAACCCFSCKSIHPRLSKPGNSNKLTGSGFYQTAAAYTWKQRDSLAILAFEQGDQPNHFWRFQKVRSVYQDSSGKKWKAVFFAAPDYFMVGTRKDWARVPLTPMAAQFIADRSDCFLPTRKMVDLIHQQADLRLEPIPLTAFRDSTVTMWQHHCLIEAQRRGRKGLISGIKKDVVICSKDVLKGRQHRVAIYGWHAANGKPIQPLYAGHIDAYVDYSHGIRLIDRRIKINGRQMDYTDVLDHPVLRKLLSDEAGVLMKRY